MGRGRVNIEGADPNKEETQRGQAAMRVKRACP
jgi:hypothetical protein